MATPIRTEPTRETFRHFRPDPTNGRMKNILSYISNGGKSIQWRSPNSAKKVMSSDCPCTLSYCACSVATLLFTYESSFIRNDNGLPYDVGQKKKEEKQITSVGLCSKQVMINTQSQYANDQRKEGRKGRESSIFHNNYPFCFDDPNSSSSIQKETKLTDATDVPFPLSWYILLVLYCTPFQSSLELFLAFLILIALLA